MRPARTAAALAAALALGGCASTVATAIKITDNDPDLITINREAQLAYEKGEDAKAEALYRSLARRMPTDSETWIRLGNLYARRNLPEDAAAAYQRALLANNTEVRAWHNLGVVRLRQAYAALLQAYANLTPANPLYRQVEAALEHLAQLPLLKEEAQAARARGAPAPAPTTAAAEPPQEKP